MDECYTLFLCEDGEKIRWVETGICERGQALAKGAVIIMISLAGKGNFFFWFYEVQASLFATESFSTYIA